MQVCPTKNDKLKISILAGSGHCRNHKNLKIHCFFVFLSFLRPVAGPTNLCWLSFGAELLSTVVGRHNETMGTK